MKFIALFITEWITFFGGMVLLCLGAMIISSQKYIANPTEMNMVGAISFLCGFGMFVLSEYLARESSIDDD